jgi:hypothetical protein
MRHLLLIALAFVLMAAAAPTQPPQRPVNPPGLQRCCAPKVFDATGKEIGEIIIYDASFPSIPLNAYVRYTVKGDSVALLVSPEGFRPVTGLGGSAVVFTSNDCSGDAFLNQITPPLTKRYIAVLPQGGAGWPFQNTHAWLYATDPLPTRVSPGATVFHSQWDSNNTCTQYPAPGQTFQPNTFGFWAHKIEDLYVKFKRPFFVP